MSKKIISNLFNYAAREGAKDLVIESAPERLALDYHFPDGECRSFGLPKKLEDDLSLALRRVLKLAPDELASKKYCKIEDKNFRLTFYLTILASGAGEKIIINIIPKNAKLLRLKQLGLQERDYKLVQKTIKRKSGLILISSPHGQGKSTTLYSLLQELNKPSHSLYFIGPRPEHELDGVNYLAAGDQNWAKLLRLDSEVIMTEIESESDLANACQAAGTGRLVVATVNADSTWEVLFAYLKLKLPLKLKLDALKLIINQRLATLQRTRTPRTTKSKNKRSEIGLFETFELNSNLNKFIQDNINDISTSKFWEKLSQAALKENYKPLGLDRQRKTKNGLL